MLNRVIASVLPYFPRKLVWLFSKIYIAGETIEDAIKISKELNSQGFKVTIDVLGEFIEDLSEAEPNTEEYLELLDSVEEAGVDGNCSLKPTSFGLLLDAEACRRNIRRIVEKAVGYGNFLRLDMEDSSCVDLEIELFRELHAEFPRHVGFVFQAYLRRTADDLRALLDIHHEETPLNIRLCKGIYSEPEEIAFQEHDEINAHFLEDLRFLFENRIYAAIATHDRYLVEKSYELINEYDIPQDGYEFQMLYGVTPELRRSIVDRGHLLRVYVPFGKDWFGYSTRRLKENPKIVRYILKALFHKG